MTIKHRLTKFKLKIKPPTSPTELKDEWIAYLEDLGYTNVKESDKYAYYDVEAIAPDGATSSSPEGRHILFELKNRTAIKPLLSTRYGDNIIQLDKLQHLLNLCNENTSAYVVNFFTDCAYINNIKKPYKIDKQKCCKTTFWGGARIEKQLVSYDHSVCDKIEYEIC